MKLRPGDYFEEIRGKVKTRISDPRGVLFEFEGSRMEFEAFMDKFNTVEKFIKERSEALDKSLEKAGPPNMTMKP